VHAANQTLFNLSQEHADFGGMGTTLVALMVEGANAYLVHAGDSRAYLYRDSQLFQITTDHTWVNEQVQRNLLSPEEARTHRWRNVITRALGNTYNIALDSQKREIRPGDIYLLCSDGLKSMVDDADLEQTLSSMNGSEEHACRQLIDLANLAGGDDNITLVVLRALS
jgi:protein phosphatase